MTDELERTLAQRVQTSRLAVWQPIRFHLSCAADRQTLAGLVDRGEVMFVHDTLLEQLGELLTARCPSAPMTPETLGLAVARHLGDCPAARYGCWVYYPWSRRLVHILPEAEYRLVRSDRNRHKITAAEQLRLRACTIGIVGLSVGQMTAATMALEGVGGRFRLADFDTLSLSNLNRLRLDVAGLGLNKAVLAARQMYEIDPYLDIEIFSEGVDDNNLDRFLTNTGKLDLLVEECDDFAMKLRLRERARSLGIPVIMETSDRGLLDVERFDREPERPLLHGLLGNLDAAQAKTLSRKERVPYAVHILGGTAMSAALAASLFEIDETISTWPQLGSAVTLGGAVATNAARRILLDQLTDSGRFYVDLAELVAEGRGVRVAAPMAPLSGSMSTPPVLPPVPSRGEGQVTAEEIRYLVAHAILAPSGGNSQPWQFVYRAGQLECRRDPAAVPSILDFEYRSTHVALGAAVENITLAAPALGLAAAVHVHDPGDARDFVCRITFDRSAEPPAPSLLSLIDAIPHRATNRRTAPYHPLDPADIAALTAAAAARGATLHLIDERSCIAAAAAVIADAERAQILTAQLHAELGSELRFTREQIDRGDGMDIATLEATHDELVALHLLVQRKTAVELQRLGGGNALVKKAIAKLSAASALGLITVPGTASRNHFEGGRAMQRVWLTATARGLAVQPHSILPYLIARLERAQGQGFAPDLYDAMRALQPRYRGIFEFSADKSEILLFRIFRAETPSVRSLRRPLETALQIA